MAIPVISFEGSRYVKLSTIEMGETFMYGGCLCICTANRTSEGFIDYVNLHSGGVGTTSSNIYVDKVDVNITIRSAK